MAAAATSAARATPASRPTGTGGSAFTAPGRRAATASSRPAQVAARACALTSAGTVMRCTAPIMNSAPLRHSEPGGTAALRADPGTLAVLRVPGRAALPRGEAPGEVIWCSSRAPGGRIRTLQMSCRPGFPAHLYLMVNPACVAAKERWSGPLDRDCEEDERSGGRGDQDRGHERGCPSGRASSCRELLRNASPGSRAPGCLLTCPLAWLPFSEDMSGRGQRAARPPPGSSRWLPARPARSRSAALPRWRRGGRGPHRTPGTEKITGTSRRVEAGKTGPACRARVTPGCSAPQCGRTGGRRTSITAAASMPISATAATAAMKTR